MTLPDDSMMDIDDDTASAYASISAQLDTWTSPRLGQQQAHSTYEEDTDQWLQQQTAAPSTDEGGRGTPIMSNQHSQRSPGGVSSPWIEPVIVSTTPSNPSYRTHHDALWRYVQGRRNLAQRLQMARDDATLQGRTSPDMNMLKRDDLRMDLELLSSLSSDTPLFSLLARLRTLGVHFMLWDEAGNQNSEIRQYISYLSTQKLLTPAKLIEKLHSSSSSPLILQRRSTILEWLEDWNAQSLNHLQLPNNKNAMWSQSLEALQRNSMTNSKVTALHPDAPLLINEPNKNNDPLYGTDNTQDKILLKACLAYILAGRIDLAQKFCQNQGQSWRCAIWNGGLPQDTVSVPNDVTQQMVQLQVGNPARFLWKRQVAKLVKVVNTDEEAAIYALLCNDWTSALSNPVLRTWQAGLYTGFKSLQGRLEDELLQLAGKTWNYEKCTLEQLQATSDLAHLDEPGILETLAASPFGEMRTSTTMQGAMASVLVGKEAVLRFFQSEVIAESSTNNLRQLVHFVVYLELLKDASTPIVLEGMEQIKNQVVQDYLSHLSLQPSLWRYITLYASFLPNNIMLSVLPDILSKIELDEERRTITTQCKDLLNGFDVDILKATIMLILSKTTSSDASKCKSIEWLTYFRDHLAEGLVCANTILRHFLIRNKSLTATNFIRLHLPDNVIANDDDSNSNAHQEFRALRCYLEAMEAFEHWKQVMVCTIPETTSKSWNRFSLQESELKIADSMGCRMFIEQKQETSQKIVKVALVAANKLLEVIAFDGGWLLEEDEDDNMENDNEDRIRQDELEKLRFQCIPEVVVMLLNVCDETATWMDASLEDGTPRLGKTIKDVLKVLDKEGGMFDPLYWICRAKGVITIVASDENEIYNAFGMQEMKHLNKLVQEIAIRELDYA